MKEIARNEGTSEFEKLKRVDDNGEYWSARELAKILEYVDYRNFREVGKKAYTACKNSGQNTLDHFVKFTTMVKIGSNAEKAIDDVRLSRYACYLIVQNADPSKEVVALGQTYFAVQTRIQEIQQMAEYTALDTEDARRLFLREELKEHNKHLATAAKEAGVIDPIDYAIFQNFGYKGLYGGLDKNGIQNIKNLDKSVNILDHMGSTELAANLFRATQTEEKLKKEQIKGRNAANRTHLEIGTKVRNAIKDIGGTMPEDLPVATSIKTIAAKAKKKLDSEK